MHASSSACLAPMGRTERRDGSKFRAASVATVLLLTAACAGNGARDAGSDGEVSDALVVDAGTSGEATVFAHPTQRDADGMDAEITGVLDVEDGCFVLQLEGLAYPVLWPAGTQPVDGDEPAVELPDGTVVEVGDEVRGGGGYLVTDRYRDEDSDASAALAACPAETGEVAVFNPKEPVDAHRP